MVVLNPGTGKTYRNTSAIELGAGKTLTVPIRATEAGKLSSALPGTIVELETTLLGVTVTNATAVVGLDAELDADLRLRCTEKLGALSPLGPWDAYAYAARSAKRPDGSTLGVTRIRQHKDGAGGVTTWVATASGPVTGAADDPSTDLGAVHAAILRSSVPECVTATTSSAAPRVLAVTYQAWAHEGSGLTDAQIESAIGAKLSAFASAQPIGANVIELQPGKVFRSALIAAIASARPEIFRVELEAPDADVELAIFEVPTLGAVNGTIHQQAAADAAE